MWKKKEAGVSKLISYKQGTAMIYAIITDGIKGEKGNVIKYQAYIQ